MKLGVAPAMRAFGRSAAVLLSGCLFFALWLPIGSASANEVTDWNVIIEQTAKASSVKPGVILSGHNASLMHLAMHDTLNSISQRHDSYIVHRSTPNANPRAAVIAAGHGVASRLYPDQASSLESIYTKMLQTIPDEPGKNEGLLLGNEIAAKVVAHCADDHFDYATAEPFVSGNGPYGSGPGAWRPAADSPHQNATFPRASLITPLALKSPSQFRNLLPGPLNLSSAKYSRELEEIRTLGGKASTARTPDQTKIAMFWGELSLFRTFNEVARNFISARNDDLWESNRTLTLLLSPLPTATSRYSMQSTTISSGVQPWRYAGLMATSPLPTPGCRYCPRHHSLSTHRVIPLPAGALKSYWRVHSAEARRFPRPPQPCFLMDIAATTVVLTMHLENASKVECSLGLTSDFQMRMLCISAST
jgi:hypothetical protein